MPTATLPQTEFRFASRAALGQIDAVKGVLRDVSLMTVGEALGHGCYCDMKTLQSVFSAAQTSPVKAYLTHGSFFQPDRLGDEVGLFSGLFIQGEQIKARQFTFFKSFREGNAQKYDAIMELAQADPGLFGVSLSFSGSLCWAMQDGTDMAFDCEDAPPDGALYDMPAVRVERIYSADFVSDPAANKNGLFDSRLRDAAKLLGIPLPKLADPKPAQVDAPQVSKPSSIHNMLKELKAAFPDSVTFARACDMFASDESLTVKDIQAKLAAEAEIARVAGIEKELATLKADLAARDEKIKQLEADKAAAAKGADPINLGANPEGTPADAAQIVEKYLSISNEADRQAYYAKHFSVIEGLRRSHGWTGKISA